MKKLKFITAICD